MQKEFDASSSLHLVTPAKKFNESIFVNKISHITENSALPAKNNQNDEELLQTKQRDELQSKVPHRPLIVVADDNATFLLFAKKIIEANGFDCITTDSPHSAVRIVIEKQPAVILCDINFGIGKTTAMDVINNIRKRNIQVPFIIVSAFMQEGFKDHAERIGIKEYLTKPIEAADLIAAIKKHVPQ